MTGRDVAILGLGLVLGAIGALTASRVTSSRGTTASASTAAPNDPPGPPKASSPPRPATSGELRDQLRELDRVRSELERRRAALSRREAELEHGNADTDRPSDPAQLGLATSPSATPARSKFDLTPQDWAELAKTASVHFCLPSGSNWKQRTQELDQLGLAAADADTLDAAYARSRSRVSEALMPLCPELADAGAPDVSRLALCAASIAHDAQRADGDAFTEARREVAEMRAGLRPLPAVGSAPSPIVRLLLAATGETNALVQDLATQYGPDEARRVVYREHGCAWSGGYGQ